MAEDGLRRREGASGEDREIQEPSKEGAHNENEASNHVQITEDQLQSPDRP